MATGEDHHVEPSHHVSPFRVLGIALVVDELGKGARMVLRYPTSSADDDTDDVFYQLSGRQMAKLFRPKPALCGQPITLSVGGTVFCCCAVVKGELNGPSESKAGEPEATGGQDELVLISVVVALTPNDRTSTFLINVGGWMEVPRNLASAPNDEVNRRRSKKMATRSFLCIQRVHVSLTRLCRVLEREERRCHYVSVQSKLVHDVRTAFQSGSGWEKYIHQPTGIQTTADDEVLSPPPPPPASQPSTSQASVTSVGQASPGSIVSSKVLNASGRRISSTFSISYDHENSKSKPTTAVEAEKQDVRLLEEEIIETMMVVKSPGYKGIEHPGNLVQELIQVFHCLRRNDFAHSPHPTTVLSGQDGVVYVNQHLAVPIEALSSTNDHALPRMHNTTNALVRPYHTLLFPRLSPGELLKSMMFTQSGSSQEMVPERRMQQFLRVTNPRKALVDIAFDASLPLPVALELATSLVMRNVCFVSPVISRNTRLACTTIGKIRENSLPFSQIFGVSISLFEIVSFLTAPRRTLGDAMKLLATSHDSPARRLRNALLDIAGVGKVERTEESEDDDDDDEQDSVLSRRRSDRLVNSLYQMVVWLCSQSVLVGLQEYLVRIDSCRATASSGSKGERAPAQSRHEAKTDSNPSLDSAPDTKLLSELQDSDCLTGKVSVQACCWKTGLDRTNLLTRIAHLNTVRLVTRVPVKGDDWGVFQ